MLSAERWLQRFDDAGFRRHLERSCGYASDGWDARAAVWRRALQTFIERFGSKPVTLCRCPGRVNLRGMHVDTHGGFLNVMTHQRETVVVVSRAPADVCTIVNCDPAFPEFSFRPGDEPTPPDPSEWEQFLGSETLEMHLRPFRGTWGIYVRGCAQSLRVRTGVPVPAFDAVVASDLPRGAALSASHALCVATLLACESIAGVELAPRERILAARDAEWYAGARTGTSDQSAMILGRAGAVLHGPLPPSNLDLSRVRHIPWPHDITLVVAQSFTSRSLSGADRLAYTANRFAYSLALEILRDALGMHDGPISLYEITEERFDTLRLLEAVRRIPEHMEIDALRTRCRGDVFEEAYARYFGNVDEAQRPRDVPLRGPLLYGIAESERARRFALCLERGEFHEAGTLMTIGHNGDRRVNPDGSDYVCRVDDEALRALEAAGAPLCMIPGVYGASSPALDALVDAALASGAYGASLTGAGIAGVVLALCANDTAHAVVDGLRTMLRSDEYCRRANLKKPLSQEQVVSGVLINRAPCGAGAVSVSG